MVTHLISLLTYLPAVGAQVTHMCSCATGFAPERTGAAPGTHLLLFHYKSVKRQSHHQRCCGCKQSFRSPPHSEAAASKLSTTGFLLVINKTTHLTTKWDFTEEHDGKATNKLLRSPVRTSPLDKSGALVCCGSRFKKYFIQT